MVLTAWVGNDKRSITGTAENEDNRRTHGDGDLHVYSGSDRQSYESVFDTTEGLRCS